jgi:hypothetical protein
MQLHQTVKWGVLEEHFRRSYQAAQKNQYRALNAVITVITVTGQWKYSYWSTRCDIDTRCSYRH